MRFVLIALTLGPVVALAGDEPVEHPSAPIVFLRPDLETARELDDLLSHQGLGSGTRTARTEARQRLQQIGIWSVPPICEAIAGRKRRKGIRLHMNGLMALGRIEDPNSLWAVRWAVTQKQHDAVAQTACLVLGLFRDNRELAANAKLLRSVLDSKARDTVKRGCAIALGKTNHSEATAALLAQAGNLPKDKYLAAALLLSAIIRSPEVDPQLFLNHDDEIVRRAAATGLLIRPLAKRDRNVIEGRIKRDAKLRPLLYFALAATPRTADIREILLGAATRSDEKKDARIAALTGLAYEFNRKENYKRLRKALRSDRNDPAQAAMLFALARTGADEAVKDLLKTLRSGSDFMRYYAGGSLLHLMFVSNPKAVHPREQEVCEALAELHTEGDGRLKALAEMTRYVRAERDLSKRADLAREWFGKPELRDSLHLWDRSPQERAWAQVNRMLVAILDLDDIAEKADLDDPNKIPAGPLQPAKKEGGRTPTGTPEEQDLLDFLYEEPYFGPGDLGER